MFPQLLVYHNVSSIFNTEDVYCSVSYYLSTCLIHHKVNKITFTYTQFRFSSVSLLKYFSNISVVEHDALSLRMLQFAGEVYSNLT